MPRTVWIREKAYGIVRAVSFKQRKSIGEVISDAIENNSELVEISEKVML